MLNFKVESFKIYVNIAVAILNAIDKVINGSNQFRGFYMRLVLILHEINLINWIIWIN